LPLRGYWCTVVRGCLDDMSLHFGDGEKGDYDPLKKTRGWSEQQPGPGLKDR